MLKQKIPPKNRKQNKEKEENGNNEIKKNQHPASVRFPRLKMKLTQWETNHKIANDQRNREIRQVIRTGK